MDNVKQLDDLHEALASTESELRDAREALARVEAERDKVRAVLERVENERKNLQEQGGKLAVRWALAVNERKAAQAQLADVLYILDQHRAWTGMGWEQLPVPVHAVENIRSKLAQAEQQEAQGAQDGEFWTWLDLAYRGGSKGEGRNFTKHNMEVACRAGAEAAQAKQGTQAGDERAEVMARLHEIAYRDTAVSVTVRAADLRAALATQPAEQLWAVHAQGPDDLYAAFSREEAEAHAASLNALPCWAGISVSAVVIESPWPAAEHWKYLVEQDREHHNAAVRGAEHDQ